MPIVVLNPISYPYWPRFVPPPSANIFHTPQLNVGGSFPRSSCIMLSCFATIIWNLCRDCHTLRV